MKVTDLVMYNQEKGCFVLRPSTPTKALNPWEELNVKRPSIFLRDVYFRAKGAGTIASTEGLGYKQFGVHPRTPNREPNKHEGVLVHAKTRPT